MAQEKRNPDTVAADVGVDEMSDRNNREANSNPWTRWARKARTDRLSVHQRRAVQLMAISPQVTPEIALRAVEARHGQA